MSTTSGLSRTRSIRTLASKEESARNKPRNETRNVSPSRLPMRPPPTTTRLTRSSTTIPSSTTTTTTTSRTRGASTIPSRTASISLAKPPSRSPENAAPPTNTRPPARPPARTASIRQAPSPAMTTSSTVTTRSVSSGRPNSSAASHSTAPKDRAPGHARAKSTATSLTAATTLRPQSRTQAPSRSNPSPAFSTASSSNTTNTAVQAKRARAASQSLASPTTTATVPLAARRPAFNTNQQHYSPAKSQAPKPLTSTFLAPPSPSKQPANVALTAETSRIQTELLQLSLLYREAHATTASWHESARSKLKQRFEDVSAADQELRATERDAAEARGLQDLVSWGNMSPESPSSERTKSSSKKKKGKGTAEDESASSKIPLDERIRLLDQVLNGVWALSEPNSRYQRAVRAFEEWASQAAEIRAAQRAGDVDALLDQGDEEEEGFGIFVSDLDTSAWKRDHAGLVRMLEGWRKTIAQLGTVDGDDGDLEPGDEDEDEDGNGNGKGNGEGVRDGASPSGLARALRGCRCLVRDMLAELEMMELMERDALAAEAEWMEVVGTQLSTNEADSRRRGGADDVPPWKLLAL
ncbi:hypothetical protein GGR50DRAFT_24157 [Xylaria sp. CBS 124048]|nr:hypothetical protein GGR50DRAFT_24157 [Xylaria sp. CBS 124048]